MDVEIKTPGFKSIDHLRDGCRSDLLEYPLHRTIGLAHRGVDVIQDRSVLARIGRAVNVCAGLRRRQVGVGEPEHCRLLIGAQPQGRVSRSRRHRVPLGPQRGQKGPLAIRIGRRHHRDPNGIRGPTVDRQDDLRFAAVQIARQSNVELVKTCEGPLRTGEKHLSRLTANGRLDSTQISVIAKSRSIHDQK